MRRLILVLTGAVALPVLAATPAFAADNVICVSMPAGTTCNAGAATITAAVTLANGNAVDDTILVGAGTYTEAPLQLFGNVHGLTLKGSGQAATFFTIADSASQQIYLTAQHATLQDLTITMKGGANSGNDRAVSLSDSAVAERVTVNGVGTLNARGLNSIDSQVKSSSVLMPLADSNSRAVYSDGGTTVSDTVMEGAQGFVHSGATTDTLSRVTIRATYTGASVDGGTINIDDAVIDLGTSSGSGIAATNFNDSTTPKTITANHVTIVGGGAGSKGVWAYAASSGGKQSAAVTVANSIIRGPATSLVAEAGNNGSQGGNSVATLAVSYTDFQTKSNPNMIGANGTGGVTEGAGNLTNVDPLFVSASDFHLTAASPVIDKGNPTAGGPAFDRDGAARVVDGDATPGAVRDMGAFERQDTTAPETTITGGPTGSTADATPTFTFTSEAGTTLACKVDAAAYAPCTSPFTTTSLAQGAHTFSVRATDAAANVDATPATRTFTVDTVGPTTTFKKKPAKLVFGGTVKFKFKASEPGARFTCSIDGGKAKTCQAKKSFKVGLGKHKVKVFATDAAGNQGKAVKYSFTRIQPCSGEC